ncbi:MAG: peptidoglycan-binding protein [Firmicutes bacterium]|nr:peptidoglycan-binding protein [Bacillota bacterium]
MSFLEFSAKTADGALPVANADIKVYDKNGAFLFETKTDGDGISEKFAVYAPDKELSLYPSPPALPYGLVDAFVKADGYDTMHIQDIQVFDTETAVVPLNMIPGNGDEYIYIPKHHLAEDEEERGQVGTNLPPPLNAPPTPYSVASARSGFVGGLRDVFIPSYITVHLGAPHNSSARNVRVRFVDYIKNVASSEIYPTWPENALIANIHVIVTFAINRVWTEWYRSRGYNFDITNSTAYDQAFVDGRNIFENISRLVDRYFNVYARRRGFRNPYFTSYCSGTTATCAGLSQWGTVTLANRGYTPLRILHNYYPNDLELVTSNNISAITESYPGYALRLGMTDNNIIRMQNFLNRIRVNYPLIPQISNPNGYFGADTESAVRAFQRAFHMAQDGVIGRSTWNRITQVYVGVTRLAELNSEGERLNIGTTPPTSVLRQGSRGNDVLELQFILNALAVYHNTIPPVIKDGVFGAGTRNSVIQFQQRFGLTPDGVVGPATWNRLYTEYRRIYEGGSGPPIQPPITPPPSTPPFPGVLLRRGMSGPSIRLVQEYLNTIRVIYPLIPGPLAEDGIFGPRTEASVIAFQRQFMLTPDGIVGPITWAKLTEQWLIATGNA